ERVGKSSAIFDERKLRWLNGRFMRALPLRGYEDLLLGHLRRYAPEDASTFESAPPDRRRMACEIVHDKAQTLEEVWPLIRFLFAEPVKDPAAWRKVMRGDAASALAEALEA